MDLNLKNLELNEELELKQKRILELENELEESKKKLADIVIELTKKDDVYGNAIDKLKLRLVEAHTQLKELKSFNAIASKSAVSGTDACTQYDETDFIASHAFSSALNTEFDQSADQPTSQISPETNEPEKSIGETLKEAAEMVVSQSSFVFDPRTRMYYDNQSGYYYDAVISSASTKSYSSFIGKPKQEKSLYYEPRSGVYYYFNEESQSYQVHSQIDAATFNTLSHIIFGSQSESKKKTRKKEKTGVKSETMKADVNSKKRDGVLKNLTSGLVEGMIKDGNCQTRSDSTPNLDVNMETVASLVGRFDTEVDGSRNDVKMEDSGEESGVSDSELEDGEVLSCESEVEEEEEEEEVKETFPTPSEIINCIPCIRAIVKTSDCLKIGTLSILTCTGATIGREPNLGHVILIPDPCVSKMHCSIEYSEELQRYVIRDHASQAGTFVNGKRIGKAKKMSEPHTLYNGDSLRIGGTIFELHIHPRQETCSDCEPGNIRVPSETSLVPISDLGKDEKDLSRRQELKKIKKKYGLGNLDYEVDRLSAYDKSKYDDRSAIRRTKHGSDNPYTYDDQPASVHKAITPNNVGHKLLSKMGWKEGDSLGTSHTGITEPIQVDFRVNQSAGLGSTAGAKMSIDNGSGIRVAEKWLKARQRYNAIPEFAD